jgi:hypothetical protein
VQRCKVQKTTQYGQKTLHPFSKKKGAITEKKGAKPHFSQKFHKKSENQKSHKNCTKNFPCKKVQKFRKKSKFHKKYNI